MKFFTVEKLNGEQQNDKTDSGFVAKIHRRDLLIILRTYDKKLIAFMDILGFRDLLQDAQNLDKLVEQITTLRANFDEKIPDIPMYVTQFSDCIVLEQRCEIFQEFAVFWFRTAIALNRLFIADIPLRGAVVYGDHYQTEKCLVSPALSKASELESQYAKNPRVLCDPSFIQLYHELAMVEEFSQGERDEWLSEMMWLDDDGLRFINFLSLSAYTIGKNNLIEPSTKVEDAVLSRNKTVIVDRLKREKKPSVISKFIWLGNYHNTYVDKQSKLLEQKKMELRIPKEILEIKKI